MKIIIPTEYIDNESTDIELEEDEGKIGAPRPYDPDKIRVDTNQFSLRNVLDMIDDREVDLAPDFQRNQVWKSEQKSRLVESVLLRIPLPAFYFSSDRRGRMQVVDGVQRLTTLHQFVRDKNSFPLSNLEYLDDQLHGKRFSDLDTEWVARINRTQLTVNVIDPQTPPRVKFDIFKRLNTGGAPLTAQEIRHCMSQNTSRSLLKKIVESPVFARALPAQIVNHRRMANREMVLRAAGFWLLEGDELGNSRYTGKRFKDYESLDNFLNDVTEIIDEKLTESATTKLEMAMLSGIDNTQRIFGDRAFRKWRQHEDYRYPVNKCLFEVWTVVLAGLEWNSIQPRAKEIKAGFRDLCMDADFENAISRGTSKPNSVEKRFSMVRALVEPIVE